MNRIGSDLINSEQELLEVMTRPNSLLIDSINNINGDIMLLGAGGKMGLSLALLIKKAVAATDKELKVTAVSRFSDNSVAESFSSNGIEIIKCDLSDEKQISLLPKHKNIIYMVGRKFGSADNQALTWGINTYLIGRVAEIFRESNIILFSTGNVYPFYQIDTEGPDEDCPTGPLGEYAQSALGRERVFQYLSEKNATRGLIFRLNYAIDLRYGVLYDLASKVYNGDEISLEMGYFNCIWQGDANLIAILCLSHASSPPAVLNVTGKQIHSVRKTAEWFGNYYSKKPRFSGEERQDALLSNAKRSYELFDFDRVPIEQMLEWTAHWIQSGKRSLDKPTHFEVRSGSF